MEQILNYKLFHLINNLAGRSYGLDVIGIFFADKLLYLFGLIIVALWFNKSLRNYVYLALSSAFISRIIIVEIIKRIINEARPYEVISNIHQLLADNEKGMAFPSGHTVIYFSFAFAFWGTKFFWPFFILAILGSLARVFVGIHFPFDILASFFIAWLTVWALRRLFKKHFLR